MDRAPLPRRAYLGFEVIAVDGDVGSPRERWLVSEVDPSSPAEEGGLLVGDEIVALDGIEVDALATLRALAGSKCAGALVRLLLVRGGAEAEISLKTGKMPLEQLTSGRVALDEVSWLRPDGAVRLRAIWTLPSSEPWAVVWLLPSATWITQETPLSTWDPSYHLVNELTSMGVATLRVDRSGLGDSEGPDCRTLDFEGEMEMWHAARAHFFDARLRDVPRFIYGRSLGGMVAPLLARGCALSGIVVWGTSSERWHQASLNSFRQQLEQKGASARDTEAEFGRIAKLLELVFVEGLTPAAARASTPELASTMPEEFAGDRVHGRVAEFFRQLDRAKIAEAWGQVRVPVLAVHAEYDILTRAAELEQLGCITGGPAEVVQLKGLDHFMHRRSSFEEAINVPWGGDFSTETTQLFVDFFRRCLS